MTMNAADTVLRAAAAAGAPAMDKLNALVVGAREQNLSFIDAILDSGQVDEDTFLRQVGASLNMDWYHELPSEPGDYSHLIGICRPQAGIRFRILPVRMLDGQGSVELVTHDPFNLEQRQAARLEVERPIRWAMTSRRVMMESLRKFYGVGADVFQEILEGREPEEDLGLGEEINVLDEDDEFANMRNLLKLILKDALEQRATDIHLEPMQNRLRIRYRVDGLLHDVAVPQNMMALKGSVISVLKNMALLKGDEKRKPQDGRISLELGQNPIDVRVATIPGVYGESVSLRLLGQDRYTLDKLELTPDLRQIVDELLQAPNGVVLVTGPTGSGKSTTLYTFLSILNTDERRIITIEDPVENKLEGATQIAVHAEVKVTFASALRSVLRSDPDVIMVGEIRDHETAEIAIQAALTGHLIFSTLHTNDAIGGITRLVDIGVEPFLISDAVRAFIAQRLVRRLCGKCKMPWRPTPAELDAVEFPPDLRAGTFYGHRQGGCKECGATGYRGRLALYEICLVTPPMQDLITRRASGGELRAQAIRDGFRNLRDYGWRKVAQGDTTIEEVLHATPADT